MGISNSFDYTPMTVFGVSKSINKLGEREDSCALHTKVLKRSASESNIDAGELENPCGLQTRKMKWRNVEKCEEEELDITAAQMSRSQAAELMVFGDESQSGDEKDQLSISMPYDLADSIDDRLSVLQHLLPHGSELDKDEILKVAIDYVKALEKKIQMFDESKQDGLANDSLSNQADAQIPSDVLDASVTSGVSALQEKGLCIVPLSAVAKAF